MLAAVALFVLTYALDRAADAGRLDVPSWVNTGSADAARTILTAIAAAVITVVGVVFSVTILALTLASTQFGPRMLRNFIRDRGIQVTLGIFVATFVFSVLALASVTSEPGGEFVPHISVTVALALTLLDLGVLIYFIHHVATSIQLTEVVHGIARDLDRVLSDLGSEVSVTDPMPASVPSMVSSAELLRRLDTEGVEIPATVEWLPAGDRTRGDRSHRRRQRRRGPDGASARPLRRARPPVGGRVASRGGTGDRERTRTRAGHRPPSDAAAGPSVRDRPARRDLLRALSPAVNDTFTALTCIDWLGDALCKLTAIGIPAGVHYDDRGRVRLVEVPLRYERVLNRAFDKIRQSGRGMPAVGIRQLENLAKIAEYTTGGDQQRLVTRQAAMILRAADEAVPEPNDRRDIHNAYDQVLAAIDARTVSA